MVGVSEYVTAPSDILHGINYQCRSNRVNLPPLARKDTARVPQGYRA